MLLVTAVCSFIVVSSIAAQFTTNRPPDEESLLCSGTGMLMFQGDGRFSIVRDSGNGSLMCDGEVSVTANSAFYTRIISNGRFVCSSSSSVRICGYGDTELISSEGSSSLLQCNGEQLLPVTENYTNTHCMGSGNFNIEGFGNYTIKANTIVCTGDAVMILPTLYEVGGRFNCAGNGAYTISGYGQLFSVSSELGNCTDESFPVIKYCSGTGEYTLVGEGTYKIATLAGNISCFGEVISYDSNVTTLGPFCCQGNDTFILDGTGFLYDAIVSHYNNCSSLIDSTPYVTNDLDTQTYCDGKGINAFTGNGNFKIIVQNNSSNNGLKCVGDVDRLYHIGINTQYTYTYGNFWCIASGYLTINGMGVVEDENLYCNTTTITPTNPPPVYSCYGAGYNFTIIGSGRFRISFSDEYNVQCEGDLYSEEASVYQSYNSYFYCYGSANFTIQLLERRIGTSLNVSADYHDCHLDTVFMKQCSGSGAYTIAGEGSYNISTRYGNVSCFGDVIFYALYATTDGPFCCQGQNDTFVLDGYGYLYDVTASYYDNCSSLIDSTDYYYISYDPYTVTSCRGTGAYAFVGN